MNSVKKNNEVSGRVRTMDKICRIIEGYKGCVVPFGGIDISDAGDYLMLKVPNMQEKNMPLAAKKILNRFREIRMVQFTGGWTEYVYSRETLKWAGYKMKSFAV